MKTAIIYDPEKIKETDLKFLVEMARKTAKKMKKHDLQPMYA